MGCKTCASTNTEGKPAGCRSGGCDRMSTLDWIQSLGIEELDPQYLVELSHKNGARKSFAKVKPGIIISTGDMVIVDPGAGTNIAKISLSGPLVGLQLKKKNVDESHITQTVIRKAGPSDIERLGQARKLENQALIKAREIARTLGLEMKIGDVEYQGDLRKATFYYTADGRVDFRELVRHYAQEFRIKVEMRQIGARQESARIGGLGSCGRELCCSTWLTDFKTVSTAAARNQNIALNQSKLSGQCGRLKCCLNYELDMYVDALKRFPKKADTIISKDSKAFLIKIDIFNNKMFYNVKQKSGRPIPIEISPSRVKEILEMNKKGEFLSHSLSSLKRIK